MEVADGQEDLLGEVADLGLGEGLPPLVQLHEGAAAAQLQEDVDVVLVLKELVEPNNVLVGERAVDLNLHRHLRRASQSSVVRGLRDMDT